MATTTENLGLTLTSDEDAKTTTFKTWRNAINGTIDSNMKKIDRRIQYGTEDKVAGESALANGVMYLVYE